MTSKKALEDLIKRNEYFKKNGVHIGTKTIDKIRELVERDTPAKVIKDTVINGVCLDYNCPSCKVRIDTDNVYPDLYYLIKHCISCGQRLDWSESI
ncbi:MAG: hypothetical protein WC939_00350 [Acholeplasmataceae bacterium]